MATLWVRQYASAGSLPISGTGVSSPMPVPMEPGTDLTPVTFTTSTQSAAFASGTTYVGFSSDAAFHYVVGENPTATTGAARVPANTTVHVGVRAGHKIAAITAS